MRQLILSLFLLLLAAPVYAVDGVLEINQACAVTTGCFAGDTAGFPVEISTAGSYVLTGNLQSATPGIVGIVVTAPDVVIDLGAFTMTGSTFATGVRFQSTATSGVIRNGTIRSFGQGIYALDGDIELRIEQVKAIDNSITGINCRRCLIMDSLITGSGSNGVWCEDCRIERTRSDNNGGSGFRFVGSRVSSLRDSSASANALDGVLCGSAACQVFDSLIKTNQGHGVVASAGSALRGNMVQSNGDAAGEDGIEAGDGSTVAGNTVQGNEDVGILCGIGCTIQDNTVESNGTTTSGDGIVAGVSSTITGNTVSGNGGDGITSTNGSTLIGNSVSLNLNDGIQCGVACTIVNNSSFDNGDTSDDHGIQCGNGCNVRGNTVRLNEGVGLSLGIETGYLQNTITNNISGTVTGGVNLGSNLCEGVVCP